MSSIKQYKKGFEILSKLSMFEEEGIVGNDNIVNFFKEIELIKLNNIVKDKYCNNLNHLLNLLKDYNKSYKQDGYSYEYSISEIKDTYEIKFLNDFNIEELETFDLYELLFYNNIIIIEIFTNPTYEDMLELYNEMLDELSYIE